LRHNTGFSGIKDITGKGKLENRWRVVNSYFQYQSIEEIGESSPTGATLGPAADEEADFEGS
jgi:hypothetical protein